MLRTLLSWIIFFIITSISLLPCSFGSNFWNFERFLFCSRNSSLSTLFSLSCCINHFWTFIFFFFILFHFFIFFFLNFLFRFFFYIFFLFFTFRHSTLLRLTSSRFRLLSNFRLLSLDFFLFTLLILFI